MISSFKVKSNWNIKELKEEFWDLLNKIIELVVL